MMKKLWKKTPAWIKAILLNLILLFPVVILIQSLIGINAQYQNHWPWCVPLALIILYVYYWLNKKYSKFKYETDVRLNFVFNWKNRQNFYSLIAIVLLVPSIITLCSYAFNINTTEQLTYIQSFRALEVQTAIPMLIILALTAGIAEEIVYRVHIQNVLVRSYGRWISFALVGLIFAAFHFLPLPLILPYVIVSILFSFVADRLRSSGVVMLAHFFVDLLSFMFLYFFPDVLKEFNMANTLILLSMLSLGVLSLFMAFKKFDTIQNLKAHEVR
jgi:membrane protease YdiL (CAAX protease family)